MNTLGFALCALTLSAWGPSQDTPPGTPQDRILVPETLPARTSGRQAVDLVPTLTIYEVGDIVWDSRPYPLHPDIVDPRGLALEPETVEQLQEVAETLATTLRHYAPEPKPEVRLVSRTTLAVHAEPKVHEWVEEMLECQRREALTFVDVSARMYLAPLGTIEALGFRGSAKLFESKQEIGQVLRTLDANPKVETYQTPRVLARGRQLATISVLKQVAYIKEYRLEVVEPGAREIADPIIDTLQEGTLFEVLPVLLPDGRLGLDVDLRLSAIERPIPTREVRLAAHVAPVTVSAPIVTTMRVESSVRLAPEAALALTTIRPGSTSETPDEPDREVIVLISAKPVRALEEK